MKIILMPFDKGEDENEDGDGDAEDWYDLIGHIYSCFQYFQSKTDINALAILMQNRNINLKIC